MTATASPSPSPELQHPHLVGRRAAPGPHRRAVHRHRRQSGEQQQQSHDELDRNQECDHHETLMDAEYKTAHCSVFHTSMPGICGYCGKLNAKSFCSACRLAVYCNKKCQRTHWKNHRPVCKRLSDVRAVAMAPLLQAATTSMTSEQQLLLPRQQKQQQQQQYSDPVTLISLQIFKHFDKRANDYMVYEAIAKQLLEEPIDLYGWSRYRVRSIFLTAKGLQYMLNNGVGVRVTSDDAQFNAYVAITSLAEYRAKGPLVDLGAYDATSSSSSSSNSEAAKLIGQGTDEFTFRHPNTDPRADAKVVHMGSQDHAKYAPIVTKASYHLKAIHFVHSGGFGRLVAAYPNQLSIRVDTARKHLMMDCYEYKPSAGSGRLRSDDLTDLPDVDKLHQFHTTVTCNPPAGIREIGSDAAAQQVVRQICHMKALAGELFASRCYRLCIPLAHVCGIRLLQEGSVDDEQSNDDENNNTSHGIPNDKPDPWDIPGILILEYNQPPDDLIHPFCVRQVATKESHFEPIGDWTPGQTASKATRHYICGAFLELQELAAYLCKIDDNIASLMADSGGTLSDDNMDFSKTPPFEGSFSIEPIADHDKPNEDAFDGSLPCLLECVKDRLRAMAEAGNKIGAAYIINHLGLA